jgi:hypothetical protein
MASITFTIRPPSAGTAVSNKPVHAVKTQTFAAAEDPFFRRGPAYLHSNPGLLLKVAEVKPSETMAERIVRLKNAPPAAVYDDPDDLMAALHA